MSECRCSCHQAAEDLGRQVRELLAALEWQRTPESERDATTVAAIAAFMGAHEFTAADMCDQARQSQRAGAVELRRALASRGALASRAAGKFLARVEGQVLNGRVVEAIGSERNALLWMVRLVSAPDCVAKLTKAVDGRARAAAG